MKSLLLTLIAMATLITANSAPAKSEGEDMHIEIWSNATAPHSNGLSGEPRVIRPYVVSNITTAELLVYKADESRNTNKAVLICPGGGYALLSMMAEGISLAKWFAENGITAAVLQYRMPNGVKEVPFEDATKAMEILRSKAKKLGFDPNKVGIVGSSAGGHLAAMVSTKAAAEVRPNFSVLFYPVITSDEAFHHANSFKALLGKEHTAQEAAEYSLDRCVDENTPPAILILCNDDPAVPSENSTLYYNALHRYKKHSALYIFPEGGHGWGNVDTIYFQKIWQTLLLDWIAKLE